MRDEAKLALMILYCGPFSRSSGVYWLDDGAAAFVLRWRTDELIAARTEFAAIGLVVHNAETSEGFIVRYLEINRSRSKRGWLVVDRQSQLAEGSDLQELAQQVYEELDPPSYGEMLREAD